MPRTTTEEKKLMDVIKRMPFEEADKTRWVDAIDTTGLNEETIKEIQAKVTELPKPDENQTVNRARDSALIVNLVRRWRLSQNLRKMR